MLFNAFTRDSKYKPWHLTQVKIDCFEILVGKNSIQLDDIDNIKLSKWKNSLHIITFRGDNIWIKIEDNNVNAPQLKSYLDRLILQPLMALLAYH